MSYIQVRPDGSIVEQDEENEKHRYLVNKGNNHFESINELAMTLRERQDVVGWLDNFKEY